MTQINTPIFLTERWIKAFSENILNHPDDCFIVKYRTKNGVLPLYRTGRGRVHSLSNYYSPYYQTFESGLEETIDITTLLSERTFTKLTMVPVTSKIIDDLKEQLNKNEFHMEKFYHTKNWRHKAIKNYDSFKKNCSSNLIKSTERYRRKLNNTDGFKVEIFRDQFSEQIFNNYRKVFETSWKKREPSFNFLKKVYSDAESIGQLRMGFIYYQEVPVSVQVWFCVNGEAYIYKLAYDESFASDRVGNVLFLEMAQHLIEVDNVESIDFLTGNDEYKSKWMTECRDLYGVNIYNKKTIIGFFGYLASNLLLAIKSLFPNS